MIDPGLAAVIAACVSLLLGLAGIWHAFSLARSTAKREQVRRQAEAYVDVLRIVEKRGLATQDLMYNLTETEHPGDPVDLPNRKIDLPPRNDRAEARALLVAYGTSRVRDAFEAWLEVIDAWEAKRDGFEYDFNMNGPSVLSREDAEPERSDELAARTVLGDVISNALK